MSSKLLIENKQLMDEWDYEKNEIDPSTLLCGSNKKVWWKCKTCGNSFDDYVYKRNNGKQCPYCNNKRTLVGFNDLKTLYPDIAKEWDYEKNQDIDINRIVIGSGRKVHWKCSKCGYEWVAPLKDRTINGRGCRACGNYKAAEKRIAKYIDKSGSIADELIISEWDYDKNKGLDPHSFTKNSSKKVWWICPNGHSYEATIANRFGLNRGCPYCSNRKILVGFNDLATTNPDLAKEWHPTKNGDLKPIDVTRGTGKKVWWICPKGHEYQATILHRSYGTNCPKCNSGRQTSFAEQALYFYLKKIYSDAINRYKEIFDNGMELDIYIPSINVAIEYDGSYWHSKNKSLQKEIKKYEICKHNNITLVRIKEKRNKLGDNYADYTYEIGENNSFSDLQDKLQLIIDEFDPNVNLISKVKYNKYTSDVRVDLSKDEFEIRNYNEVNVKDSFGDLYPDLAKEWHPTRNGTQTPFNYKPKSDFKAWWKCSKCGHEWQTAICHRTNGTGCPNCYEEYRKDHHAEAKKIYQYTLDGEFIKEWNSIAKAGRELKINNANISECAHHKRNMAGGFKWEFKKIN